MAKTIIYLIEKINGWEIHIVRGTDNLTKAGKLIEKWRFAGSFALMGKRLETPILEWHGGPVIKQAVINEIQGDLTSPWMGFKITFAIMTIKKAIKYWKYSNYSQHKTKSWNKQVFR